MQRKELLPYFAIGLAILLIANMVLLGLGLIDDLIFWIIIGVGFVSSRLMFPKKKKDIKKKS